MRLRAASFDALKSCCPSGFVITYLHVQLQHGFVTTSERSDWGGRGDLLIQKPHSRHSATGQFVMTARPSHWGLQCTRLDAWLALVAYTIWWRVIIGVVWVLPLCSDIEGEKRERSPSYLTNQKKPGSEHPALSTQNTVPSQRPCYYSKVKQIKHQAAVGPPPRKQNYKQRAIGTLLIFPPLHVECAVLARDQVRCGEMLGTPDSSGE